MLASHEQLPVMELWELRDDFGMQFPQRHNRQLLACTVLLSTVLGKTVDQSEYMFNDACFTKVQYQRPYPENQLRSVSTGYLS
jgi:hypothetical protein